MDAAAYARQLKLLLPPGLVWLLETNSHISQTLLAIATELTRVDARALALLEEADPRTTSELLEDWERVLGLPDGCVIALPSTDAERRNAIVAKLIARGGQRPEFFVELAAGLGVTARVLEFRPYVLRSGFRSGDRCYGIQWVHIWALVSEAAVSVGLVLAPPEIRTVTTDIAGGVLATSTCSYKLTAINAAGESSPSAAGSVVIGPGELTSANTIQWHTVTGATGYKIYGRTAGAWLLIATVGVTGSYVDTGAITPSGAPPIDTPTMSTLGFVDTVGGFLLGNTQYFYRVSAVDGSGRETFLSAEVSDTTPAGTDTNQLEPTWLAVPGAATYRLYRRTAANPVPRLLAETAGLFYTDNTDFVPRRLPPTASLARPAGLPLTEKALSLECIVDRAAPAHSIALFQFE